MSFSQGRRQTYLIINCMSAETSFFYRLFVARLRQVFALYLIVCQKRGAKREHDRAWLVNRSFLSVIAYKQEVWSSTFPLALKGACKQAGFRYHSDPQW